MDGAGNVSGGGFNNYPAGNHTIGVTSSGDSTYNGTSSSTVLTINKATPTVTVACSPNPISYGSQSTTCTAHTSGGGGPVTMYWNGLGSLWGSGSFDGGGNFSLSGFNGQPAGNYAVIANSSGDANYNGASGSTVVTINKTTPSVSFSVSPNPITFGLQATTVSVHVGCNTSCGFVDFRYDGAEWTTIPLDGGGNASAATGLGTNPAGDHTFQVNYLGDANNNAVSTAPQIWTILQAPTTTTITSTLTPTKEGQNVSWPCTVTSPGGTPTGTITYTDNGNFVTSSTVPGGVAWGGTGLPVGTHVIGCSFAAQGNFAASSSSVTQVVIPAISSTVTELTTSNNAYPYADSTTLSALVDTGGNAPTGTVTFKSNGVEIGSGNLTSVSATNLIPYSQQVGGTSWSGYCGDSSSIVLNTSDFSAPDGTTTATKFTIPGAPGCGSGGAVGAIDTIAAGLTAGQTYTISVWMRGSKGGEVVGFGLNDNAGGGAALTTSWHRYSVTLQNIPQGVADAGRGFQVVDWTPNDVFYVWGAQVEQSTLVGPYVATYSTPTTGQGGLATLTTLLLPVGNNSIVANYEGDPNDYSSISQPIVVTVIKATPAITWASPSAITYGTALSGTQLNATTRGIPGTFVYTPAAGTVLGAGTQTLSVNFIPDDSVSYNGATATVSLTVNKAAPTLSWATPSAITYGMALSGTQLNATSGGIAGTFVYSPAAGTVLGVGTQTLSVNFIPDDPATYNGATTTLSLTVNKASPTLSWATPSAITYGTALSGAQLNATSGGVAGTFVYSPAAGTVLGAGTQTLGVTFIPTDSANYNGATTTISLTVNKATPTLSWATPSSIIYGTALSGAQLNATSGGLAGTFVYSPASGTVLAAGTQTLSATFSPSDTADYSSQTVTTSLLVTKATPGITLTSTQDPSSYGDRIAFNVQLTGVGGSIPSGSIVLYDGGMLLTTISLDATGKGTYSTANLPANIHNIKGVYSGDTNYQ
ncbi:beta strand repeat-containing protein [Edaphobacter modestus]|uniref:beta strand repeat-containing protein n=1 Tax=Edaphobacter modestus TaxID=388466 RepID=UPI0013EE64EB|nr:Ig-like domain-containing protein [Edaphobacter modestus]